MSKFLDKAKARIADLDDGWMDKSIVQEKEAERRRQQEAKQEQERQKQIAQHRQYQQTNADFIQKIVGGDVSLEAVSATLEDELHKLRGQLAETGARLLQLEAESKTDLGDTDAENLMAAAMQRYKAESAEVRALYLVQTELQRRITTKEAQLSEARVVVLKESRRRLHLYADQIIASLHEPLLTLDAKFKELRSVEDAIRGMGGARQGFAGPSLMGGVEHIISRWPKEMQEIEQCSEAH